MRRDRRGSLRHGVDSRPGEHAHPRRIRTGVSHVHRRPGVLAAQADCHEERGIRTRWRAGAHQLFRFRSGRVAARRFRRRGDRHRRHAGDVVDGHRDETAHRTTRAEFASRPARHQRAVVPGPDRGAVPDPHSRAGRRYRAVGVDGTRVGPAEKRARARRHLSGRSMVAATVFPRSRLGEVA